MTEKVNTAEFDRIVKKMPPEKVKEGNRNLKKYGVIVVWAGLLIAYIWYSSQNNLSPLDTVQLMIDWLGSSLWGPLIFILLYMVRPLLFFSATLLTLAAGYLFGPVWGVIYTIVGSNLSASIAYVIGRYFGQGLRDSKQMGQLINKYADRLRNNSFETVLTMRFIFLPYDLVNYLAGFLHIRWGAFALAGMLGALPGTISFALFGSAIEGDFNGGTPEFNPVVIGISAVIFVASLGLSRYLKWRETKQNE